MLRYGLEHKNNTHEVVSTALDHARGISGRLHQSAGSVVIVQEECERQRGK